MEEVDFMVLGGGVVGCALLERIQKSFPHSSCCLIEGKQILSGASAGNSGILHTGFDAPLGSIEAECMTKGSALVRELFHSFLDRPPFSLKECGALMVSWSEEDDQYIQKVAAKIPASVTFEFWTSEQVYRYERNLRRTPKARGGLWIPQESVIDPFTFPLFLLSVAKQNGAQIYTNTRFLSAKHIIDSNEHLKWLITLQPKNGPPVDLKAKVFINCAGNYGDMVEEIVFKDKEPPFHITPRKGQFLVYEKNSGQLLSATILPIPTMRTKGVLVCKTIFGNVIVGPTAEDQIERQTASTTEEMKLFLKAKGELILPGLKEYMIIGMYAGLRPSSEHRDYQIRVEPEHSYLCVGAIRSTGLTACMGIAQYVMEKIQEIPYVRELYREQYQLPTGVWNVHYKQEEKDSSQVSLCSSPLHHSPIPVTHHLPNICIISSL